ncbi:occludin isoform X1, partial [Silurus asotus]
MSQHTFSHYPDDKLLHFYTWGSPPGVIKILSIIIIIMCVAVFACVASTLAWDYDMDNMGLGGLGMGMGMGGMGGSSYGGGGYNMYGGGIGGGSYGYGGGGYYMDPTTGKGFIIGISAITFFAMLIIFILVISRQSTAKSPRFYLASIIICAILALFMLIGSVVYLVAVNPTAQGTGSMMYNMIWQLCSQYQNQQQATGLFINQYMYHYCVVEPQEAIAIVLGFLVGIGLIIMMVFAIRTRSQMNRYGPHRVLWEEPRSFNDGLSHGVEKWVTDVSGGPETYLNEHNDYVGSSRNYLDHSLDVGKPLYLPGLTQAVECGKSSKVLFILQPEYPAPQETSHVACQKPVFRTFIGGQYFSECVSEDYDTGGESADELEEGDYESEFPPIVKESERADYKRQFDRDMMEYKRLQAELDDINQGLADVDRELDGLQEGSPQFLDAMEVYTRLKGLKRSSDYQVKKKRCKQLKDKLSLLKKRVNDYDRRS